MSKSGKMIIAVKGSPVTVISLNKTDFISLTDIARYKEPDRSDQVIQNWMRNSNTVEFFGIWERLYNPDFKPLEFEGFKKQAGLQTRKTIEFLGVREQTHDPDSKGGEFETFKRQVALRNGYTVMIPGIGERAHNPDGNYGEFATIKSRTFAPKARLYLSPGLRPGNMNKTPLRAESPSY